MFREVELVFVTLTNTFATNPARAGKMTEFEGAPQFEKYGLAPNLKDRQ